MAISLEWVERGSTHVISIFGLMTLLEVVTPVGGVDDGSILRLVDDSWDAENATRGVLKMQCVKNAPEGLFKTHVVFHDKMTAKIVHSLEVTGDIMGASLTDPKFTPCHGNRISRRATK